MLASRKVVKCELRTEGSETAKVGTDEQEVHKRLQNEATTRYWTFTPY